MSNPSSFDFDYENALAGINNDEIRLAISGCAAGIHADIRCGVNDEVLRIKLVSACRIE